MILFSDIQMPGNLIANAVRLIFICLFLFFSLQIFSQCSGNDYDSGGESNNYSNYENVVKTFTAPSGSRLVITFNSFNLENGYDFLKIYDGPNTTSNLMANLTGSLITGPYISSGNSLTIEFTSDYSVTKSGWIISLSCITVIDCSNIPSLDFQNPVLQSGILGDVGSTYLFSDVLPGIADAKLTIENKSHSDIDIVSLDEVSSTYGGYDEAFQPIIDFNWINANGSIDPVGDRYVTFTLDFLAAGTSDPVIIPQLATTGIDIDGSGAANKINEFIRSSGYQSYSNQVTSTLALSGALKATGPDQNFSGIDDTELDIMLSFNFSGVSSFTFDYGAEYGGNTSIVAGDEQRHNSLFFKCYGFDQTVCQPLDPPTGPDISRCGPGPVMLSATGCNGVIHWFEEANGGGSLHTGNTFVTPILNENKTYYVECYDVGCVSDIRSAITAVILESDCAEICDNGIDDDGDGLIDCIDGDCGQLYNREFDLGIMNWDLHLHNGSMATFSIDDSSKLSGINSAFIDITTAGGMKDDITLSQDSLSLISGLKYIVLLDAFVDSPKSIGIEVRQQQSPFTVYTDQNINLAATDSSYYISFVAPSNVTEDVEVLFKFGEDDTDVYLDNLQFKEDCKGVCIPIPDTILLCNNGILETDFDLPDAIDQDYWSILYSPPGSSPAIDIYTGIISNMNEPGQYIAYLSGPLCTDTVEITNELCDVPCLCDGSSSEGFTDWSNLGTTPVYGPIINNFNAFVPGHSNIVVSQILTNGGVTYTANQNFTDKDRVAYEALNFNSTTNEPLYLETGMNTVQNLVLDFTSPMGDFDLVFYDIDEYDEISIKALDANGNVITNFSSWLVRGSGDASIFGLGGSHRIAPPPYFDEIKGIFTSSNSENFNTNFISIRPDKLISQIEINYTSSQAGDHVFVDLYGSQRATNCPELDLSNCLSEFNFISFGPVIVDNSEIQGKACFCDDATLTNYNIGDLYGVDVGEDMIYADGTFTMSNGAVQGGPIFGTEGINLSNITNEIGNTSAPLPNSFPNDVSLALDCDLEKEYFNGLADTLQNLSSNGVVYQNGNTITLDASGSSGIVKFILSSGYYSGKSFELINSTNTSLVVLEFMHNDPKLSSVNFGSGFNYTQSKILMTTPNASRLRISDVDFFGSLLIPNTLLVMENGSVTGTVVVNGYSMNDGTLDLPSGAAGSVLTCTSGNSCDLNQKFSGDLPEIEYSGCKFHYKNEDVCSNDLIQFFPNQNVLWESSDQAVASITNAGLALAAKEGTAFLTYENVLTGCPSLDTITLGIVDEVSFNTVVSSHVNCDVLGSINFIFQDTLNTNTLDISIDGGTSFNYSCQPTDVAYIIDNLNVGIYHVVVKWHDNKCEMDLGDFEVQNRCFNNNYFCDLNDDDYNYCVGDILNGNVVDNDIFNDLLDNPPLQIIQNVSKGSLNLNNDGSFNYLSIEHGVDSFKYELCVNIIKEEIPPEDCRKARQLSVMYEGTGSVTVSVTNKNGGYVLGTFYNVENGDVLVIDNNTGTFNGKFNNWEFYINNSFNTEIHTSCSIPILGYTFGDFYVLGYISQTYVVNTMIEQQCCEATAYLEGFEPQIAITSTLDTICAGETITLDVNGSSSVTPYNYMWNHNLGVGTSKTITLDSTKTFSVTLTDALGCTDVISKTIIVNQPPIGNYVIPQNYVCDGDSILLYVTPPALNYQWNENGGFSNSDSITVLPPTYNSFNGNTPQTNYSITITDAYECKDTLSFDLWSYSNPTVTTTDTLICEGDTALISAIATTHLYADTLNYIWSNGVVDTSFFSSPFISTEYVLTVTDNFGCSTIDTTSLTVDTLVTPLFTIENEICLGETTIILPNSDGSWSSSDESVAIISNSGVIQSIGEGLVTFTYTNNSTGCISEVSDTFFVNPSLEVAIDFNGTICLNDSSLLVAEPIGGSGEYMYNWVGPNSFTSINDSINILENGNYFLTITDHTGCEAKTSGYIFNEFSPTIFSLSTDICEGDSVELSIATPSSQSYQWGSNAGNVTSSSATVNPSPPSTTYNVTVTNDQGCSANTSITINVYEKPEISFVGDDSICVGEISIISPQVNGVWTSTNTSVANIDNNGLISAVGQGIATFLYQDTVSNCVSDTSASIVVQDIPSISIAGSDSICINENTQLLSSHIGVWESLDSNIITINDSGSVFAKSNGDAIIILVDTIFGCASDSMTNIHVHLPPTYSISGSHEICVNETTLLQTTYIGNWSVTDNNVAEVYQNGIVTGLSEGNVTFEFTDSITGCPSLVSDSVTVYALPNINIIDSTIICEDDSILINADQLGSWILSDTNLAGIVGVWLKGENTGTLDLSFTNDATGCQSDTAVIYISPKPILSNNINSNMCEGDTTMLTSTSTGIWEVLDNTLGTIDSNSGEFVALSQGTAKIYFTSIDGCKSDTMDITIQATPIPEFTGLDSLCIGSTTSLTPSSGGTWQSTNTSVATISGTGVATAVGPGTTTFIFTSDIGCSAQTLEELYVDQNGAITLTGDGSLCLGETTDMDASKGGGGWISSDESIATIGNQGLVATLSPGIVTITYQHNSLSCSSDPTFTIEIHPIPSINLIGSSQICVPSTTQVVTNFSGGMWSTSDSNIASIATSGIITSVNQGSVTIGVVNPVTTCASDTTISIEVFPALNTSIGLVGAVCLEDTTQLYTFESGGTTPFSYSWSGPGGFLASTDTIDIINNGNYYVTVTDSIGCTDQTSAFIYERYEPFIFTLNSNICEGENVTLNVNSNSAQSYQWGPSGNNSTASSITVTPSPPNTEYIVTVTNDLGCSSIAVAQIDVTPSPIINLVGPSNICEGDSSSVVPNSGGLWSSSNPSIASVSDIGTVYGHTPGSVILTYQDAVSGCSANVGTSITVAEKPTVSLSGPDSICIGQASNVTASSPGIWVSSNPAIAAVTPSGVVLGNSSGDATLSFYENTIGCKADEEIGIYVHPTPSTNYTGPETVCIDDTTSIVSIAEGQWISLNPAHALIDSNGQIVAMQSGTARFIFTSNSSGCSSNPSTLLNINQRPTLNMGTLYKLCEESQETISPSSGGIWQSLDTTIATINNNGLITGVNEGFVGFQFLDTITGCLSDTTRILEIIDKPEPFIQGLDTICNGETSTLTPSINGYWTSSDVNIATIANNGLVESLAPGEVTFTFISDEGICISDPSDTLTILSLPNVTISGPLALCIGDTSQLQPSSGGTWSSSDPGIATIDSTGRVVAVGPGSVTFTYMHNATGCVSKESMPLLVYPDPNAQVLGPQVICIGQTTSLSPSSGGFWVSSNPSIATITNGGVVTGNSPGFVDFTFTSQGTGCVSIINSSIEVTPKPVVSITGDNVLCEGEFSSLTPSTGGFWTSNNPSAASVDSFGIVEAISQGIAIFTFTSTLGCTANNTSPIIIYSNPIVVNPNDNILCTDEQMTLLANGIGFWQSSNPSVATIDSSGTITAISAGTTSFTYTDINTTCQSNASSNIDVIQRSPVNLSGDSVICIGGTTQFSPTTGGFWFTTDPTIATINSSGLVTGIDTGTVAFYYLNLTTNCFSDTTAPVSVIGSSLPQLLNGTSICKGDTSFILPNTNGGTWEVANPTIASVNNNGLIIGLGQGTTKFRHVDSSGCTSIWSIPFTVNDPPSVQALGSNIICLGDSTLISPYSGGYWTFGDSSIIEMPMTGIVKAISGGISSMKFTDMITGCESEDSILIHVLDNPNLVNNGDSLICIGFTTQVSSESGNPIWFSSDSRIASVDQNGKVIGIAPGKTEIFTIDLITGCRSYKDGVIITVEKCFNHDFNVTLTKTDLTGNVSTNDEKGLNIFYMYDESNRLSQSQPQFSIDSSGVYTFYAEEKGKYKYQISICQVDNPPECYATTLEVSVVGNIFATNNVVNNLEFISTYADSLITNPGVLVSANINSNDKCINSLGCTLNQNQRSFTKNTLFASASFANSSNLDYQPHPNFVGLDTIRYQVCSQLGNCKSSPLFLTVRKRNAKNTIDAPDDFNFMAVGTSVSGNVLDNDFDPEGDSLYVIPNGMLGNLIPIFGGGYYIESDGNYTFIPDPGFVGNTSFIYNLCDDNVNPVCKEATVHLIVYGDMSITARVYLEGALITNGNATSNIDGRPLMRDDLRANPNTGLCNIPLVDPYSGFVGMIDLSAKYTHLGPGLLSENKIILDSLDVFSISGPNAIVDWVFMEIRSKSDSTLTLATRSALLQRDGDIVDLDGKSPVKFTSFGVDSFYLVVNHRSHLGVMSQLVTNDDLIDFTEPNMPVYDFGTNNDFGLDYSGLAMNNNVKIGYRALWSGDFDGNGKVKFTNPEDDQNMLFFEVLFHINNLVTKANFDFGYGYAQGDFNMNGKVKFTNPNDDKNMVFGQIILYPLNTNLLDNFDYFIEQIPK